MRHHLEEIVKILLVMMRELTQIISKKLKVNEKFHHQNSATRISKRTRIILRCLNVRKGIKEIQGARSLQNAKMALKIMLEDLNALLQL